MGRPSRASSSSEAGTAGSENVRHGCQRSACRTQNVRVVARNNWKASRRTHAHGLGVAPRTLVGKGGQVSLSPRGHPSAALLTTLDHPRDRLNEDRPELLDVRLDQAWDFPQIAFGGGLQLGDSLQHRLGQNGFCFLVPWHLDDLLACPHELLVNLYPELVPWHGRAVLVRHIDHVPGSLLLSAAWLLRFQALEDQPTPPMEVVPSTALVHAKGGDDVLVLIVRSMRFLDQNVLQDHAAQDALHLRLLHALSLPILG
mmetsp:Transcript_1507/g.9265  ORF Transcript_1507/g.9265 Transcript_1507/m.9265 type:complete len:257 (+) Transcript_1507:1012-1782(+)